MTGERGASLSPTPQGKHLPPGIPGALCSCGCGGQATKASGYRWAYVHDPGVPEAERLAGRQLGGRRGAMTAAEVSRLLEGAELTTSEGRQALRDRFTRLRLGGRIGNILFRDLMLVLSDAAKDQAKGSSQPTTRTIEVISRYGPTEKPA